MTIIEFRNIRKSLSLTQSQLAAKLGYRRRVTITEKESGRVNITARDIIILKQLVASCDLTQSCRHKPQQTT